MEEVEGFRIEHEVKVKVNLTGRSKRLTSTNFAIGHSKERIYADLFFGKTHQIFISNHPALGPIVVCLKKEKIGGEKEKEEDNDSLVSLSRSVSLKDRTKGSAPSLRGRAGSLTEADRVPGVQFRVILWSRRGREHNVFPGFKTSKMDSFFQAVALHFNLEKNSLKSLSKVSSQKTIKLSTELKRLEETETQESLLFGVVYGKDSQRELDEMFGNKDGSPGFERFMDFLGKKISLQECSPQMMTFAGFGGNDRDDKSISIYHTEHDSYRLAYHVSTCLPFDTSDPQQITRKRKIGNDIVVIAFNEGDQKLLPTHRSKVNHVVISVRPTFVADTAIEYSIAVASKKEVPEFGPALKDMEFNDIDSFRSFFLTKIINASRAAYHSAPGFRREETTKILLDDLVGRYTESQKWVPWSKSFKKGMTVRLSEDDFNKGLCFSCQKPISSFSDGITALGNVYHTEHFCCEHCFVPFGNNPFVVHPTSGNVYCEEDFKNLFTPQCAACGEELEYFVRALGKTWHNIHFVCSVCKEPFGENPFYEKDGEVYCAKDFKEGFGPKCAKCYEFIEEEYEMFQGETYHPSCHVCMVCAEPISGAYKLVQGLPSHSSCFSCHLCRIPFSKENPDFFFEGFPYCSHHFHEKQGMICEECKEAITSGSFSRLPGGEGSRDRVFHSNHFFCSQCRKVIGDDSSYSLDPKGNPLCSACSSQ